MRMSLRLKIALGLLVIPTLVAIMLFILVSAAFRDISARTRELHDAAQEQAERFRAAAEEAERVRSTIPGITEELTGLIVGDAEMWLSDQLGESRRAAKSFDQLDTKGQKMYLLELVRDEFNSGDEGSAPFKTWAFYEAEHIRQVLSLVEAKGQPQEAVVFSSGGEFGENHTAMTDSAELQLAARALATGRSQAQADLVCLVWPRLVASGGDGVDDSPSSERSRDDPSANDGTSNATQSAAPDENIINGQRGVEPMWLFIFRMQNPLPSGVDGLEVAPLDDEFAEIEPAPIDSYVNAIAGTIALGALLFIGMLMLTVQRVVMRPLEALVSGSRRIASGDYSLVLPEPGGEDEMSRLIRAFNHMQGEIRQYQREMQKRIDESMSRIREQERSLVVAQRLAATGTLAAGLAHEINNPLGSMLNSVRRIQKKSDDPRTLEYCELIQEGVERIQNLMGSILDFSRRRDTKPDFFDLRRVLKRSADYVRYRFKGNRHLEVNLPDALPQAWGDENGIGQVIVNLLLNANDALGDEGGTVTLRAREIDERSVEFMVSDDGGGMDDETKIRIFDPFFTTKGVGKGTGLGLSIVHTIVSNHEGIISVDSERGQGTTFTVTLPLVSPADVEGGEAPSLKPVEPSLPLEADPSSRSDQGEAP